MPDKINDNNGINDQPTDKVVGVVKKKRVRRKKPEVYIPITANSPNKVYLTNKELLAAVKDSRQTGEMSDRLSRMLQLLCARYGKKGNFVNYTYNEDMQAHAMMMLVKTWHSFNPEKSNNPFAYFTRCVHRSFIQYLKSEKKQRIIRDVMLTDSGYDASLNYQMENDEHIRDRTVCGEFYKETTTDDATFYHHQHETAEQYHARTNKDHEKRINN